MSFYKYVTPKEYFALCKSSHTLKELEKMSRKDGTCIVCENDRWKLADTDLCFQCTTGEHDESEDYELKEPE